MIQLSEKDVGKLITFRWVNTLYKKVLVTKGETQTGDTRVMLLNNDYPNADCHLDKSVYKHCLVFDDWQTITSLYDIRYLEEDLTGRYLKVLKDSPQCIVILEKGDLVFTKEHGALSIQKHPDSTGYSYNPQDIYPNGQQYWELMPIDFKPSKHFATTPKKLNELKYPDVIQVSNEEEFNKVKSVLGLKKYSISHDRYLVEQRGYGNSDKKHYEYENYVIYQMDQIIFDDKMIEIQNDCKKRFPIGCKFISTEGDTYILKDDDCTYSIRDNYIWAGDCQGCLYENGTYATLVEDTVTKEDKFPEEGYCRSTDSRLLTYLSSNRTFSYEDKVSIGYAWNKVKFWKVSAASSKKEYELKDLEKYFMKEEFEIGKKYKHNGGQLAYFCGYNSLKEPVFELINISAAKLSEDRMPANFISKGNNTFWAYIGLEKAFDPRPIKESVEKQKFEVNKWYQVELANTFNHYMKFKKFDSKKGYIADLTDWNKGESVELCTITSFRLLTNLSEIQEFLPEDHVDRFCEYYEYIQPSNRAFTKGKIYKVIDSSNLEADSNFIDDVGDSNGYSGTNYQFFKPSTKDQYDKQNSMKQEDEFKVGDWIVIVAGKSGHSKEYDGKCQQITKIVNDLSHISYIITEECKEGLWYKHSSYKQEFRRAFPHEIPSNPIWTPKIGDWVVLLQGKDNWDPTMDNYVGKCVQLLKHYSSDREGVFSIKEDYQYWTWEYTDRVKHFRKAEIHEIASITGANFHKAIEDTLGKKELFTIPVISFNGDTFSQGNIHVSNNGYGRIFSESWTPLGDGIINQIQTNKINLSGFIQLPKNEITEIKPFKIK